MITIGPLEDYEYFRGSTFTVEWYRASDGSMKAKKYYEELSDEDQKRLDDLVIYLANSPIGTHLPKNLYNEEDSKNKIYALKSKDHRFFNFMVEGRKIIIVNAYRKHSQQMTKKDLNLLRTVIKSRTDYLRRVKEGIYYDRIA